jgi:small-conductance mechanosensitive channel
MGVQDVSEMAVPMDEVGAVAGTLWEELATNYDAWLWSGAWVVVSGAIGWVIYRIFYAMLRRVLRRRLPFLRRKHKDDEGERKDLSELALPPLRRPLRLLFPVLTTKFFAIPAMRVQEMSEGVIEIVDHALQLGLIGAFTWAVVGAIYAAELVIDTRHRIDVSDNLAARRVQTQMEVIKQVLVVLAVIVGVAVALMTFEGVRQFGTSLLASAGLAGLVVGFAARPILENIIAGIQVALTQPIRLDDVVIIEGEWGRIEEITTTYVVVRIWDERRLIVPFSKILSEAFQNWTRTSADILGTVELYADYTTPVEEVRQALKAYVKDHPKWDQRVAGLQVTDATDRTMKLRGLVSAANASDAWDLRCDLREHLIDFLQREHPDCLPRERELHVRHDGEPRTAPPDRPSEGGDSSTGGDPEDA